MISKLTRARTSGLATTRLESFLAICCVTFAAALPVVALLGSVPDDLQVYKGGVDSWASGGSLYDFTRPNGDRFTYPPVAALLLFWVHWLDGGALAAIWMVASLLAVGVLVIAISRATGASKAVTAGLLLVSSAVLSNFQFGQVSIAVAALCVADCCLVPRRFRGYLTGVAMAMKLTPLLFAPYFLVRRQWGNLARSAASAGTLTLLAFLIDPAATREYMGSGVGQVSTVSHWDRPANQSLRAVLARLGGTAEHLYLPLAVLLVAVVLTAVAMRPLRSRLTEWTLIGLTTVAVSPISWTHHRVWLTIPLLMPWLWEWRRAWTVRLALAAFTVVPAPLAVFPIRDAAFISCLVLMALVLIKGRAPRINPNSAGGLALTRSHDHPQAASS